MNIKQDLLNNQGGNGEIKGEIEKYLRQMKMEVQHSKIYGMQQSGSKRKILSS